MVGMEVVVLLGERIDYVLSAPSSDSQRICAGSRPFRYRRVASPFVSTISPSGR